VNVINGVAATRKGVLSVQRPSARKLAASGSPYIVEALDVVLVEVVT
jgi:hypothetical protein